MIGLLFHGPEVFDSGWAARVIQTFDPLGERCCILAGTMGRTAVFDSGLSGIEFKDEMPGACLRELAARAETVVMVNYGKSEESGLVFGQMVVERSGIATPMVQAECSGPFFVEWIQGSPPAVIQALTSLGLVPRQGIQRRPSLWKEKEKTIRRITTADAGDFVLVNGIMVGRAKGGDVILTCENGRICDVLGAEVKAHGIEKLDRLGRVDLETAKLATTPTIRRTSCIPRTMETSGENMVFLDHAGMHVYGMIDNTRGVVTVGDDTTAVAADILSRFRIPVIGIVDGDEDVVLKNGCVAPGSVRLTVKSDDEFGLKILASVFQGKTQIKMPFHQVLDRILSMAGNDLLEKKVYGPALPSLKTQKITTFSMQKQYV